MKQLLNNIKLQSVSIRSSKRIFLMILLGIGVTLSSCKKDGDGEGNIKVSASYGSRSDGSYSYFFVSGFTVKLYEEDGTTLISTQNTNGPGTIDLGTYPHGVYTITVSGTEGSVGLYSGNVNNNHRTLSATHNNIYHTESTTTVSFSF